MKRDFHALSIHELGPQSGVRRPTQSVSTRVTLESPALEVMTDLTRVAPATIRAQAPIEGANQFMITRGVRLLLVVDDSESVLGLISATDILGETAMRVATERGMKHDELTVADIMTPAARIEVLEFADVPGARVGHIVETLKRAGRQHTLVAEADSNTGRRMVRGIFSLSQIARQLGVAIQPSEVARTFADLEAALGR